MSFKILQNLKNQITFKKNYVRIGNYTKTCLIAFMGANVT